MKKVLVAYSTMSCTTSEVARTIAEELKKDVRFEVTLANIAEAEELTQYDSFVIGGPMILGWQREVRKFLAKNRSAIGEKPLALFATAMSLTDSGETQVEDVPVAVDPGLALAPLKAGHLSFKEKYAAIPNYVKPMLQAAGKNKPVSVALLGGRLDIYRLKPWATLFVMLIIQAKPGEKRNWEFIRAWAGQIAASL